MASGRQCPARRRRKQAAPEASWSERIAHPLLRHAQLQPRAAVLPVAGPLSSRRGGESGRTVGRRAAPCSTPRGLGAPARLPRQRQLAGEVGGVAQVALEVKAQVGLDGIVGQPLAGLIGWRPTARRFMHGRGECKECVS